jgi:photosystem II stability/assembly factor-like uncharacterized protein
LNYAQIQQAADGSLIGELRVGRLDSGTHTLALEALRPSSLTQPTSGNGVAIAIVGKPPYGEARIDLAPASFQVTAPPNWSSLGIHHVLATAATEPLVEQTIAASPANPGDLAYCDHGRVYVSHDVGATWTSFATTGASDALAAAGFTSLGPPGQSATCLQVTFDPTHPASLYLTFVAAKQPDGAPPEYFLGVVTPDLGQSWKLVLPPASDSTALFGGFETDANAVVALFGDRPSGAGAAATYLIQRTLDGGRSWVAARLACPSTGPCVRWGPAPNGIGSCAMHPYNQPILVSTDGGQKWVAADWPSGANGCSPNRLVALSPSDILLFPGSIVNQDDFPVLRSSDGGQTWEPIALPAGFQPGESGFPGPSRVLLLDGSLLAFGQAASSTAARWELVPAGARAWCAVDDVGLPAANVRSPIEVLGNRLWWIAADGPDGTPLTPKSLPIVAIRCAGAS